MKKLITLIAFVLLAGYSYSQTGPCIGSSTISISPPPDPATGCYFPGNTVTVCVTINDYAQNGVDWLCGVVPLLGPGWDSTTLTPVSGPASCDGQGNWAWYNTCTSTNSGLTFGAGYFYDSPAGSVSGTLDGIPGNNFGDNCQVYTWVFCFQVTASLTGSPGATGGIGVTAYGDDLAGSWGQSGCVDPPITSSYCIANCTVTVPTLVTTDVTGCYGDSTGTATVTPSGGFPPYSYLWSTGATTDSISGLGGGVYSVIVTDSSGCVKTVYLQIQQPQQITFNASVINIGCSGTGTGSIFTYAGGGTAPYSYLWSTGATTDSLTGLSIGSYTLTITDSSGCSNTNSFTITTVPPFVIDSTATTQATCGISNGTAAIYVSGTPPYTYVWNPPVSTTNTATGLNAGVYDVQVTDSNGCIVNTSITVNSTGTFTLTPQSTGLDCSGAGGTATVTIAGTTGPYAYLWSTGATTDSLSGLTAGTYTVTVTDINGCSLTVNTTIQPYIPIALTTTMTPASCNSNNGSATVTATGGSGQYSYLWNPGGLTTQSISNVPPGTYTVIVTDANATTCMDSSVIIITQNPAVLLSISSDTTICNGQSATINTNATGGTPGFSYLWSDGSSAASVTVNPTSTTPYTVIVTDITGCTAMATSTVTVVQYPVISITQDATICEGESIQLNASGGTTYSWTPDDGSLVNVNTGSPVAAPGSTTNYIVTASNGSCSTVDSVEITVLPAPDAIIVVDSSGGNNIVFTNNSTGGTTYLWDFGDGATATTLDASHTYASGGIYEGYLVVSNANGCTDTARFTITTNSALIIHNVLTPNGDTHNDLWNFEMHGISNIAVEVYNRWGVKIFDKSNFGSGVDGVVGVWDGVTSNGETAPDGTYFYIVKAKSVTEEYDRSGTITLIRKEK